MRRWRDRIARHVQLFVTTTADILPPWVDRNRVLEIEWGADVEHFRPRGNGERRFAADPNRVQCVFAGAFRSWHGVVQLSATLARLHEAGDHRFGAIFIGDGPERAAAERVARGLPGVTFTGALPHAELPAALASADIGVAPVRPAAARAASARLLLVAAEDLRVHGRRPSGRRAGPPAAEAVWSSTAAKDCFTIQLSPEVSTTRSCRSPTLPSGSVWARRRGLVSFAISAGPRIAPRWTSGCARWSPDECAAQRSRRDRLLSARVRRQRLEHVGAGARAAGPRPPRRGGQGRDRIAGRHRVRPPRIGAGHDVPPRGAERARAPQHGQERGALARPDHLPDAQAAGRRPGGHHPRAARDDDGAIGAGRRRDGDAGGRHGARLLAGLLLVRSDLRPVATNALPGMLGADDDRVHQAARRRRRRGRVAADPVHARQPPYEAAHAGQGERRHRGQLDDRARPPRPRAGARRHAALHDPESGRHDGARSGACVERADRRAVHPVRRQARHQQGRSVPAPGHRARGHRFACRHRRRRPAARFDRAARRRLGS